MTRPLRLALVTFVLLALGGCASWSPPAERATRADSPRVRCLSDPGEHTTRPLFFFLCMQSP